MRTRERIHQVIDWADTVLMFLFAAGVIFMAGMFLYALWYLLF